MSYEIGNKLFEFIVNHGGVLLELGSGLGSERLTNEGIEVHSIEYNKNYVNKYNTNYYFVPLDGKWFNVTDLTNALKTVPEYDLILVDAPAGVNGDDRMGFINQLHLFNTDCTIIIDDTHRFSEMKLALKVSATLERGVTFHNDGEKQFAVI